MVYSNSCMEGIKIWVQFQGLMPICMHQDTPRIGPISCVNFAFWQFITERFGLILASSPQGEK